NRRLNARALALGAFVWRMGGCIRRIRIICAGLDGRGLFPREKRDRRVQFQDRRIDQSIWSRVLESNKIARTNRDSLGPRKYSHHGKTSARCMGIDSGNCAIAHHVIPSLTASPTRTEGPRDATLKLSPRDSSAGVRDDR